MAFIFFLGLAGFSLSWILLLLGLPFMKTWFFCFVWWSFILLVDALNYRSRGSSPLSRSKKDFAFKALISVFIWLLFELFNLRLGNWSYHGLPPDRLERWLGYFIAFATVVPALEELSFFFEPLFAGRFRLFRIKISTFLLRISVFLGLLSIFLTLLWPRLFFPLAWLCFIFLLEPFNYRVRTPSLLAELERGEWKKFWSIACAGFLAGFFWEFFNFWAGSHWEYHLPYLDFGRVFEMPVLGYSGFLPFALEVFALSSFLSYVWKRMIRKNLWLIVLFISLLVTSFGVAFKLIDRFTLLFR